jgi:hypothetical protein
MACDCEAPSVGEFSTPVARAPHRCCECRRTIQIGESYERYRGCWDGTWTTWITCFMCGHVRDWIEVNTDEDCIAFGTLVQSVEEAIREPPMVATWPEDPTICGWAAGIVMRVRLAREDDRERRRAEWRAKKAEVRDVR